MCLLSYVGLWIFTLVSQTTSEQQNLSQPCCHLKGEGHNTFLSAGPTCSAEKLQVTS